MFKLFGFLFFRFNDLPVIFSCLMFLVLINTGVILIIKTSASLFLLGNDSNQSFVAEMNNRIIEPHSEKTGFLHMQKHKEADQLRSN